MLKILKLANNLRARAESASFENATRYPREAQTRFLFDLLKKNAGTEFGRAHRFDEVRTLADFRRQTPVRDYEALRPFIDRLIGGRENVLTREAPFMFTLTSGTTSEPKYVPVTRESQRRGAALFRQWIYRAERDHRGLTAQPGVGVVSRAVEGYTAGGLPYGSASGVIYRGIPRFVRRAYAVPYEAAEIVDYDERYFAIARFALSSRVSYIATPNPTTLLRLAETLRQNGERLIRAVAEGTLGAPLAAENDVRRALAARLTPNRARARELARLIADRGFLRPADCWPDLKLIGCWLGGSVGLRAADLAEFYGDVPRRDLGYLASEGSFTMPVADGTPAGVLAVAGNFYEFIPEKEIESRSPTVLTADELEAGNRYEILLTTSAGLYRYRIGDVVEATGFYNRAPMLRFVRKAGEAASITGEKMHANHFLEAFADLARKFDLEIERFCAVANFEASRYDVYLELKNAVLSSEFVENEILPALDAALQSANLEYREKRRSRRLAAPVIFLMKSGWARAGLRRHVRSGKRDTQYKPPVLCRAVEAETERFVAASVGTEKSATAASSRAVVK